MLAMNIFLRLAAIRHRKLKREDARLLARLHV